MVAPFNPNQTQLKHDVYGQLVGELHMQTMQTRNPQINEAFVVGQTQQSLNHQQYKYSFTYILITLRDDTVVDRGAILNRIVPGQNNKMVGIEISNQSIINKEPMRLLITDMTVYERGQPLLELNLLINKQRNHVIPVQFMTSWTQIPLNRQVDMTIPPIGSLDIEVALASPNNAVLRSP